MDLNNKGDLFSEPVPSSGGIVANDHAYAGYAVLFHEAGLPSILLIF